MVGKAQLTMRSNKTGLKPVGSRPRFRQRLRSVKRVVFFSTSTLLSLSTKIREYAA